ncbi:golgin subfamily A member 6-like protein 25 [Palaemon carinicauda]|uniref:golgin subfamily A member 6-like protein 25 n=1 Tax=Palaemon carinicauda TaxID=392227 RepID=UPI0035B5EBAF
MQCKRLMFAYDALLVGYIKEKRHKLVTRVNLGNRLVMRANENQEDGDKLDALTIENIYIKQKLFEKELQVESLENRLTYERMNNQTLQVNSTEKEKKKVEEEKQHAPELESYLQELFEEEESDAEKGDCRVFLQSRLIEKPKLEKPALKYFNVVHMRLVFDWGKRQRYFEGVETLLGDGRKYLVPLYRTYDHEPGGADIIWAIITCIRKSTVSDENDGVGVQEVQEKVECEDDNGEEVEEKVESEDDNREEVQEVEGKIECEDDNGEEVQEVEEKVESEDDNREEVQEVEEKVESEDDNREEVQEVEEKVESEDDNREEVQEVEEKVESEDDNREEVQEVEEKVESEDDNREEVQEVEEKVESENDNREEVQEVEEKVESEDDNREVEEKDESEDDVGVEVMEVEKYGEGEGEEFHVQLEQGVDIIRAIIESIRTSCVSKE